jgi:hypothetical protein|tara:strand:- start:1286 stop:1414 length:129 start_codon:yes stop_codon:yes gene_type:complete
MKNKKNKINLDLENKNKEFYNKNSKNWDYYSGLPNPKAYENL